VTCHSSAAPAQDSALWSRKLGRRTLNFGPGDCAEWVTAIDFLTYACLVGSGSRFGAVCQSLVLESDVYQVFSNSVHRCVVREIAQASSLRAIVFAGHPWSVERGGLHSVEIVAPSPVVGRSPVSRGNCRDRYFIRCCDLGDVAVVPALSLCWHRPDLAHDASLELAGSTEAADCR
jgi:hypothetical protein